MPKRKRKAAAAGDGKGTAATTPKRVKRTGSGAAAVSPDPPNTVCHLTDPALPLPTADTTPENTTKDMACRLVSVFRDMLTSHVASHPECNEQAPAMSKYMRNKFAFMGLKAPARRALQKEFLAVNREASQDRVTVISFVRALWGQDEREFQGFGVDLLVECRDVVLGETEQDFHGAMGLGEYCVVTKSWWDTVDTIAYQVVGYFVEQRASLGVPLMRKWIDHDYLWLRRVAILHQLSRRKSTDQELLFGFCLRQANDTDFFIRKAIGWALREYAKTNKKAVKKFVGENKSSLSALSTKEALKHC